MSEAEVLLLSLEVEAAAVRNADLSRQLERLTDELACSTVHRLEKVETVSVGTQTEFDVLRDVSLDLDDLLFEMAEVMFRLYPTTPIDLSSREGDKCKRLEELSQRCLREMRSLRTAWETKLEGYNKFIEDLQKALGGYYRSLEGLQCQLRDKEVECATLSKENAQLLRQCAELEKQLKFVQKDAANANNKVEHLMQQTTDLEFERCRLLDRETVLANTLDSLRADCALGPWGDRTVFKSKALEKGRGNSHIPHREKETPTSGTDRGVSGGFSVQDVMWACQGSTVNRAFPEFCLPPEKVIDFGCKFNPST
ncbi:uncharacterized protein TM35_000054560 [Trypanosoma theileri]|uniref:Uncharacterized protein n=1 Tax=Trypanosoma theileri TaxID=67003 RepID=A0A1X0P602_9TRYP|nr:uncharacterized protein TM35_000054560 [Trypanosoma theileri]ORC91860.1 hypothetical protein TM35_000054560 [Trypanosoma theileri]